MVRPRLYTWLLAIVALQAAATVAHADPGLLTHHRGRTTLTLSGRTRLTLSQGCHQLRVGQGRPWRVRTRQTAAGAPEIVSSTTAGLNIKDGRVSVTSAGLRAQLRGATIENPVEVMRGLLNGAPKRDLKDLVWRGVNQVAGDHVSYSPGLFTVKRRAGPSGEVEVGLQGQLKVGVIDKAHRWSQRYDRDAARRWIHRTFQGSGDSRAQLLSLLGQLAPAERGLVAGLVQAQLAGKGEGTASLRAGQHRLQPGCTIEIGEGTRATLRLEMTGSTSRGKVRLSSATATVGLSKPVQLSQPLSALHALRGRRGSGLGRAVRRAVDRMLNLSIDSLQLERSGGEAGTRVRMRGTLKLFNRFSLGLDRRVTLEDSSLRGTDPARLTGLLKSADVGLSLSLQSAGSPARLELETRPSLRFEAGTVKLTAPTELRTPGVHGSYTVEGSHTF